MPVKEPAVKWTGLCLAIIVLLTMAIRLPLLDIPLERDEGEYAYIAWRLGHHELPYRDWVDQKPPGIFWVYRLALDLPFESISRSMAWPWHSRRLRLWPCSSWRDDS